MQTSSNILVIGSSNTDMVIRTDHFPAPGETIIGGEFFMNPGGKGANQAVAAVRLGGRVSFISRVGNDIFGKQTLQNLAEEGMDISGVATDPDYPSGVAQILVDRNGENCIVVASGSNMSLGGPDIDKNTGLISAAEIVLVQLEIPVSTIEYAAKTAFKKNCKVILNPAPAAELPDNLFSCLYLITPNETEAEYYTGIRITGEDSASEAAEFFIRKGVRNVIITLGAAGAYIHSGDIRKIIPAPPVKALDTTAAGDTFNGALAVALSRNMDIVHAVEFAGKAAALAVTRMGAQSSIPYLEEIQKHIF